MNRSSNPEPDAQALIRHRLDLNNAREALQARWSFQSKNPLVAILETNRAIALAAFQSSERALEQLLAPTEPHSPARPEDCCCPDCRAEVDAWAIDWNGLVVADHPKVDPYPSERELSRDFVIDEF